MHQKQRGHPFGCPLLLFIRFRDWNSIGLLMRGLGAPEASAACGGYSEPERAGQRRRAMRAHCMRDVSATRRNRMSPWRCTKESHSERTGFFFVPPPARAPGPPFALRAPVQLAGTLGQKNLPRAGFLYALVWRCTKSNEDIRMDFLVGFSYTSGNGRDKSFPFNSCKDK